jgi:type I restriction enzyme S subunit
MAYKQVLLGDYFKFEKGLGYKGEFLVEDSEVALIGMDSHEEGGAYKEESEKPYSGPYKPEHVAETGDVIFAATDLTQGGDVLGSPLMVPESDKFETFIYSHHLLKAFQKREGFLPEYLYNLYRVKKYRRKAAYGDSGSTVRALPADVLEEQLVPLPDVKTQESINEIIALIDQQIENNKSLAKNLEALAQSIFRSWFVDFEPVHAKARGEKPFGMDDETAELFPDSFEESESGLIPKGWQEVRFQDLGKIVTGKTPSTKIKDFWGKDIPFVTIPDMTKQRFTLKADRYLSQIGADSQKNQFIPIGSTSVSCIATPGLVAYAFVECHTNQQINSIIPFPAYPNEWVFFRVDSEIHKIRERSGIGTVFSNLNKSGFSSLETIAPSEPKIMVAFSEYANPLMQEIRTLVLVNEDLESLRDNLLSSFISGDVEVANVK